MGRTTDWLAEQRPAMVALLKSMEQGFHVDDVATSDLESVLERLRNVVAEDGEPPRSMAAMRKAWWRWTSDSQHTTPPVRELALMVRFAKMQGWLRDLNRPDCLLLVNRLLRVLKEGKDSEIRERRLAWTPIAQATADGLMNALALRTAQRALPKVDGTEGGVGSIDSVVIQHEVGAMLKAVIEETLRVLNSPRPMGPSGAQSTYLQVREGWPDVFRDMARDVSGILEGAATEYSQIEASLSERDATRAGVGRSPRPSR